MNFKSKSEEQETILGKPKMDEKETANGGKNGFVLKERWGR